MDIIKKIKFLKKILTEYKSLAVALSGGIDSAFLLMFAKKVLNTNLLAITSKSIIHLNENLYISKEIASKLGIRHIFFDSIEIQFDDFLRNNNKRCYFCKKKMFKILKNIANINGFYNVAHGENVDDFSNYRPGRLAVKEFKIQSPLFKAGFSKKDIRLVSKIYGFHIWNKPSVSCIATKISYGIKINFINLKMVKKADFFLRRFGFEHFRIKHFGPFAKVKIYLDNNNVLLIFSIKDRIVNVLNEIGFKYVLFDLKDCR